MSNSFRTAKSNFQRSFSFDDFYAAAAIREMLLRNFPEGKQKIPNNIYDDEKERSVPFQGLGEVIFFPTEQAYREPMMLRREEYEHTQQTERKRPELVDLLVPQTTEGVLVICELEPNDTRYRVMTTFEATELGYCLKSF